MTSIPLTFKELQEGDKFIGFPTDGDDEGHGGYRNGSYVFIKLRLSKGSKEENACRLIDGVLTKWGDNMQVYKVMI